MNTLRISATKARNNFFTLLDQVALGQEVIIEKDSKEVAVLSPKKESFDWVAFRQAARETQGILKGYTTDELLPLRKKSAWKNFGKWK